MALPNICYRNIHLGKSLIDIKQGKLNQTEFISHWSKIKNLDKKLFNEYKKKVAELWKLKNNFTWEILDNKGINIYEGASFNNLLELIADDYEN